MARTTAPRNALRSYTTTYSHEGRRWSESVQADSLETAELHAKNQAYTRGIRNVETLPLNPEA